MGVGKKEIRSDLFCLKREMTHYYPQPHSAHDPPEVRALPPEQDHHLCASRPAHQGDGKAIAKILQTKPTDLLVSYVYYTYHLSLSNLNTPLGSMI